MKMLKNLIPKMAIVSGCSALFINNKYSMSPQPPLSQILRGQYQNRIRRYSPPQKIFDVFATIKTANGLQMTLKDLLKAICFYNFSTCTEEELGQTFQPQAILAFMGKKTNFEIYDYFMLVRFLAYERLKIIDFFSKNKIQIMTKQQFRAFLKDSVCEDYSQFIKSPLGIQSRQFRPTQNSYQKSIDQGVQSVFKKYPNGFNLGDMIQFRRNMIRQLFQFQFLMFPRVQDKIDGTDFARSIIKYVDSAKRRKYLRRVKDQTQEIEKFMITKDAYIGFHFYMQTNLGQIVNLLQKKGAVTPSEIQNLINGYVKQHRRVTPQQAQILVKLLDVDDSGFIQKRQFMGVLSNLQYYTKVKSGQHSIQQMLKEDYKVIKHKLNQILEIIQE